MYIADPEVAERIIRDVPKSPTYRLSWPVIGRRSIISLPGGKVPLYSITDASGDEWKQQRRIFNPSFSPKKLIETSLKKMCDQAVVFVEILENLTVTGETFPFHQCIKVSERFSALLTEVPYNRYNRQYDFRCPTQYPTFSITTGTPLCGTN
jgi:cytochrome P450